MVWKFRLAAGVTGAAEAGDSGIVPLPSPPATHGAPGGAAAVRTADAFLRTLRGGQRAAAVLPFDSPLRANWSNLPETVTRFDRNGLRLGDLEPDQLAAAFAFLGAALSPHGYETVAVCRTWGCSQSIMATVLARRVPTAEVGVDACKALDPAGVVLNAPEPVKRHVRGPKRRRDTPS